MAQTRMPSDAYCELASAAASAVPSNHRRTIVAALKRGNDVSLEQRLLETTRRFGPLIPGILAEDERRVFGRHCAAMRNAMAHHLPGKQQIDLAQLSTHSRFILHLL